MGSTFISKVRICLNPLKPFLHQTSSAFLIVNSSLCKSSQLLPTARFLCSGDTNPNSGGRQTVRMNNGHTDGQGGVKSRAIRHRQGELGEDKVDGGGKSSSIKKSPSFPKSVFSAGTAKRIAEMQKRKAALASVGEEEPEKEAEERKTKGAGGTHWNFLLY